MENLYYRLANEKEIICFQIKRKLLPDSQIRVISISSIYPYMLDNDDLFGRSINRKEAFTLLNTYITQFRNRVYVNRGIPPYLKVQIRVARMLIDQIKKEEEAKIQRDIRLNELNERKLKTNSSNNACIIITSFDKIKDAHDEYMDSFEY